MKLDQFLNSAVLSLFSEITSTDVGEVQEVEVSIAAFHPMLPNGTIMTFATFMNVSKETNIIDFLNARIANKHAFPFVPKPEIELDEFFESSPIQGLNEHWQEDFITPYSKAINTLLTEAMSERMCYAQIVHRDRFA